ncbi:MAG: helix-turn-helix transcriptional regulator, partial [Betaproteobacteria bacterium]
TWLADVQRSLAMSGHPRFFPKTCVQITPRTRKLTEEFVMELWWADEVSINRLESLLFDLIKTVIEGCKGWRVLVSMLRSRPPAAMDPRVRRSIAMMKSDLSLSMDMDQIAAEIGLSRSHFFSLFQRDTQVTPLVYANVLRFESAIDQLSKTNRSVGEVADSLGFAVPGHFARFFRQHLGITPTEYRRVVNLYEPTSQASVAAAI